MYMLMELIYYVSCNMIPLCYLWPWPGQWVLLCPGSASPSPWRPWHSFGFVSPLPGEPATALQQEPVSGGKPTQQKYTAHISGQFIQSKSITVKTISVVNIISFKALYLNEFTGNCSHRINKMNNHNQITKQKNATRTKIFNTDFYSF